MGARRESYAFVATNTWNRVGVFGIAQLIVMMPCFAFAQSAPVPDLFLPADSSAERGIETVEATSEGAAIGHPLHAVRHDQRHQSRKVYCVGTGPCPRTLGRALSLDTLHPCE